MGREKRGGYIFEWWIGDHPPPHVHVYKDGKFIARITVPDLLVLSGRSNKKIEKAIEDLIKAGKIKVN